MSEQNKVFIRHFMETMDRKAWDELRELMAPDHRFHWPLAPEPLDREGHIQLNRGFQEAFSGFRHEIHDVLADRDKVVVRGTVRATHTAAFQGIPPSGKEVALRFIDIVRIAGDVNAEEWLEIDSWGFMQQLGVV
ncbi:MAG: ester cyclase [Chloroflexi bacterium]|nr:ester cyclase [Chloroflexota bacterium]